MKMYKELMILGICSLFLFLEEQMDLMNKMTGSSFNKHLFETIHMMLFAVVCVYIALIVYFLVYSIILANTFKKMEQVTEEESDEIQATYTSMKKEQRRLGTLLSYLKLWWRWRYEGVRFHRQFLQIKELFINQHMELMPKIAEPEYFEFYIYMRKCIRTVCIQLAAIHWQVWLMTLGIVFIESLFFETTESAAEHQSTNVYVMLVNADLLWLTVLYMLVIWKKSIKATDRICEKYDECCITNKLLTKEAELEKKRKQKKDEEEGLLVASEDSDSSSSKSKKKKEKEKKKKKKVDDESASLSRDRDTAEEEEEDEEDENELHGDTPEFHSGAALFGIVSPHQKLFPFNSPSLVLRSIQFCVLLLSILLPLFVVEMWDEIQAAEPELKWFINLSMLIAPLILCVIVVPNTLPRFVLATSVASMTRYAMARETIAKLEKQQEREQRKREREERMENRSAKKAEKAV